MGKELALRRYEARNSTGGLGVDVKGPVDGVKVLAECYVLISASQPVGWQPHRCAFG